MKAFAYCCASFGQRLARLAGVTPLTCPPATDDTFDLGLLSGRDFVWLKLHGVQGQPYWYGDHWTTALSADRLATADLRGAVVFVSNCHLYRTSHGVDWPSQMLIALGQANPRAIIGGSGINYARLNRVSGTDLLGLYIRFFLRIGFVPFNALRLAKARLNIYRNDFANKDTLSFRLWNPRELPHARSTVRFKDPNASTDPGPA